jgi:hypothetical protein
VIMGLPRVNLKLPGGKRLETQRKTVGGTVSVGVTGNREEEGRRQEDT